MPSNKKEQMNEIR